MRAEGLGDAGAEGGLGGEGGGQVVGDVVAGGEEQRDEYGVPAFGGEVGEGGVEERGVQLDVREAYVESGPQLADAVEEPVQGGAGAGVPAAVADGDEGGGGRGRYREGGSGRACDVHGRGYLLLLLPWPVAVRTQVAELGSELLGDPAEQPGGVGERAVRLRHAPILRVPGCLPVARGSRLFSPPSRVCFGGLTGLARRLSGRVRPSTLPPFPIPNHGIPFPL